MTITNKIFTPAECSTVKTLLDQLIAYRDKKQSCQSEEDKIKLLLATMLIELLQPILEQKNASLELTFNTKKIDSFLLDDRPGLEHPDVKVEISHLGDKVSENRRRAFSTKVKMSKLKSYFNQAMTLISQGPEATEPYRNMHVQSTQERISQSPSKLKGNKADERGAGCAAPLPQFSVWSNPSPLTREMKEFLDQEWNDDFNVTWPPP